MIRKNVVTDFRINSIVQMHDALRNATILRQVSGVVEGDKDIGAVLRRWQAQRAKDIGANIKQRLDAGLQAMERRIEVGTARPASRA